ncbi:MAG TPA: leukotoxin LktA family filamentous adhesin [Pseudomonas sp.]
MSRKARPRPSHAAFAPSHGFPRNRVAAAILLSLGASPSLAAENVITVHNGTFATADGSPILGLKTDTHITVNGQVTDITTNTVRGQTGFNSFGRFEVASGNTVNLHVPGGAQNLVNLVHDSRAVINGTLNGLKDGKIGGNIIFADPHGLVVGSSGVVNVGSLTVTTPNTQQMTQLASLATQGTNDQGTTTAERLMAGEFNDSGSLVGGPEGKIDIQGAVNSNGAINLFGAQAVIAAGARLHASTEAAQAVFVSTVNVEGASLGQGITRQDGAIRIVGNDSVEVRGELAALMADTRGGEVYVESERAITLAGNATIRTSGAAGRDAGDVTLQAAEISLKDRAQISTVATGQGKSGDIALNAYSDTGVSVHADVDSVEKLAEDLRDQARGPLALNTGKAAISIAKDARLDAGHAVAERQGNVSLTALAYDRQLGGYASANATIDVAGTLVGRDVLIRALSEASISGSLFSTWFSTGALKDDFQAIVDARGGDVTQAWADVLDTLFDPINGYERPTTLDDLGFTAESASSWSELVALLPYLTIAIADANARVTLDASAVIDASRDVQLQSLATREVDASTSSIPGLNGKLPFNAGLAYGRISGVGLVEVKSGARVDASQDLRIQALSDNRLAIEATATNSKDGNGGQATTAGFAFGMAHSDISTEVKVADGAVLNVGRDVEATALSEQTLSNEVAFKSTGEGAVGGPAVALSLFNSTTRAQFDADLSGSRNLNVSAVNLVHEQNTSSTVQAGKGQKEFLIARAMQIASPITTLIGANVKEFFGMKPDPKATEPSESKFRLASATSIGIASHTAEAVVGSGSGSSAGPAAPRLSLTGNLAIQALQTQEALHNSADSTVNSEAEKDDGTAVALSVAAVYSQLEQNTRALLGDGSQVSALNLGLGARNQQLLELGNLDRWGSFSDVTSNLWSLASSLPDVPGSLSTSYANSTGGADKLSMAGSISVLRSNQTANAWIGDNVNVTTSGTGAWSSKPLAGLAQLLDDEGQPLAGREALRAITWNWAESVSVKADTLIQQLAITGNFWWGLFNNGADDGGAVGAGLNIQINDNRTVAGIGAAQITSAGLQVAAEQDELVIGISPAAGKGPSVSANGALVVSVHDATVHASISDDARVTAGRVGIFADHHLGLWSAAGALSASENAGIGGGLAINVLTSDVLALVGDNRAWRPKGWAQVTHDSDRAHWYVDQLDLSALSDGQSAALAVAGAMARGEKEQEKQDETAAKDGGADSGSLKIAESLGDAVLQSLTLGLGDVSAGLTSAKDSLVQVKDTVVKAPETIKGYWDKFTGLFKKGDAGSGPDSGGDSGGGKGIGLALAGSGSLNVSGQKSRAHLGDIVLDPRDPQGPKSKVGVLALNQTHQLSGSGAGALTLAGGQKKEFSSAISGAVAYNHLFNVTEALVQRVTLEDNQALKVQALSGGDQIAMGLGLAVATGGETNVGVALSASGGAITNRTRAAVIDSQVHQVQSDGIAVTAYDRSRVLLGGGAFAGSNGKGGSAGASLVVGVLANDLAAEWLSSDATGFARLDVSANSASRILAGALAGAVAVGSESGAGAGSMLALVLTNKVRARIDASDLNENAAIDLGELSLLRGAAVNVNAQSLSGLSDMDGQFDSAAARTLATSDLDLNGDSTVSAIDVKSQTDNKLFDENAQAGTSSSHDLFDGQLAGEAVLAVAGGLGASGGKAGVGGALAVIYAGSDYTATVANTEVDLDGALKVAASNNTDVLAAAIAAAGSTEVGVSGSSTALIGRGSVQAGVEAGLRPLRAQSLSVSALKNGGMYALSGNITGSANTASVGGAFAITDMQHSVEASVGTGDYRLAGDLDLKAAQESRIIAAALSGAVSGSGVAVGGALTYNRIAGTTRAVLEHADVEAGNLRIAASQPGSGANIWSLAFNLAAGGGAAGVGAAVAVNLIEAEREAMIDDSNVRLSGSAHLTSALDGAIWGVGIDAAGGNTAGVGGSIVVNNIGGSDSVSVQRSTLRSSGVAQALSLDASAGNGLMIASLAGSVTGGGTASVGGALSVNRIGVDRTALISHSEIGGFAGNQLKSGAKQSIYAAAIAGGGAGNVAVNGSSTSNVLEGTERAAMEASRLDDAGSLSLSAAEGERTIWSLAGAVGGAGSVSVGVANANNIILSKRQAEITASTVDLRTGLSLSAGGASAVRSAAVGAGGSGSAAAGASLAINVIEGEESARLKDSSVNASTVTVEVLRGQADIKTLAGNVQGAGSGAGAGAVAVSTIGQTRKASIEGSILNASGAIRVQAVTQGNIDTVAISGAGGGSGAAAFSNTSNNIAARTQASVERSAGSAGSLSILASDESSIHAGSGGVAGAGTAAVGGATAVNRIDSRIAASLSGNRDAGWALTNLVLDAHAASDIIAAALSAGVASNAAVSGVLATNIVQTQANAHIGDGARVVAQNNVGVSARNLDSILGNALVLAGSGNAAVSALATVNLVESRTQAWIDGSDTHVSALARNASDTLLIDSGVLANAPDDEHEWISGEQFNPRPNLGIEQHRVTGLAVQASSVQQIGQLSVSAALAVIPLYSAAVSGVGNSSVVAGATRAYIEDASINQAAGAANAQNVRVGAHGHSFVVGYLGAIAGGPSAASVSGSLDSTVISRATEAYLRGVTLHSLGATQVLAGSSQYATSVAASFSGAIVGVGGTANVTVLKGSTEARVEGGSRLNVGSLAVRASARQNLSPNLVTVAGGGVAVGGALATVYNQSHTRAWVGSALDGTVLPPASRTAIQGGAVNIEASNSTSMLQQVASAGGGLAAVGGSVAVTVLETVTEAGASQADFGSASERVGAVSITARDGMSLTSTVGSAQVGALSVGGSANVLVLNSANRALLDRSTLYSLGDVSLQALREGNVVLNTITGSLGVASVAGSIGMLLMGPGAVTVSAQGETVDPMRELDRDGNGSLAQSNRDAGATRVDTLAYRDYVRDPDTGEYRLVEVTDSGSSDRINASSKAGMGNRLSGSAANVHETVARVSGGVLDSHGAISVRAEDALATRNLAGNAALGVANAMGAATAFTFSNARVAADLLGTALKGRTLSVRARSLDLGSGPAVQVNALSGSGSLNGALGAAIGVAVLNNVTRSDLSGTFVVDQGVSVLAEDTQNLSVESLGAAVGALAGAGLVLGVAAHDSSVSVSLAPGASIAATDIDLTSRSQSAVTLTGRGAGGGVGAGVNATILVARDQSNAALSVGGALQASGGLALLAEANPHVAATSQGLAIGGAAAAGGSLAIALAKAGANLSLGSNALLQARHAVLASRVGLNAGRDSATVKAESVAGGFGVSVNAAVATASNQSSALLVSEDTARFVGLGNGDWSFAASTGVRQRATAEGYSGALLALGATVSEASASTLTRALVAGRFSGDIGKLSVSAYGSADNLARTRAGQGGLVSGAAALATTRDTSNTQARLYIRGADGLAQARLGALSLGAHYQAVFNSFADSINAALLGASGARASNLVGATTASELASGSRLEAGAYEQSARTDITKADTAEYNVTSGSGGVVDAAAALSSTLVTLNTRADIGSNVRLTLAGDWRNPEHLRVHAFNNVLLRDKVKLDSGGAIAVAAAQSLIEVASALAGVNVGSDSELHSVGNLVLSASGFYDVQAQANAKTWGLAGAAQGRSLASVNADYDVDVGTGTQLFSYGDTRLHAGYDVAGSMNKAVLSARTDLWNNTAFPVLTDPDADAIYLRDSHLRLGSGSHVRSVGDIYAYAGKGYGVLTGAGVGKDLYREAASAILGAIVGEVSLDIKGGSTRNSGTAVVTANGTLDAGVYSQQKLTITGLRYLLNGQEVDLANLPSNPSGTLTVEPILAEISDGISYRMVRGEYSQLINSRITELKKQLTDYGLSAQERTAFQAELNLLNQTLGKIYQQMGGDPATGTLPAQLPVWIIEIDPILARPGNILVQGDALVGSGALNAPGDAKIEIINQSAAFLDIRGLEIPDREGGQLLFNGARMLGNASIAAANLAGHGSAAFNVTVAENSPAPSIIVRNTYNPATGQTDAAGLRAPAPDINVNGLIANKRGSIELSASYGSIYTNADVRGQTLRISAGQNFVLNNPNAFTHIGGDPATNNNGSYLSGPRAGSGVVAGNNVVISALYLNLNGLVQSGVADWSVNIQESQFANLDALRAAYRNGTGAAVVQLVATDARTGTVGFSYDFRNESILLDHLQVGGGYMELTGQIVSTGNGQLKVLDGFSQVSVVNNTNRNLNISGIDLGSGVAGMLKINDVGRHVGGEAWSTLYTYNNGQVQRYEGRSNEVQATAAYLKGSVDGRNATYQTVNGRTYVWLTGRDTTDTATRVEYWDAFWGFIPTGDGTQLSYHVQKGSATAIDGAEYMGSLSNAYKIDYDRRNQDILAAIEREDFETALALAGASWDSAMLIPYRLALGSGEMLVQQDQRYATNGAEVIDQYLGGYCKTHFIWCQVYRTTRTTVTQQGFKEIDRYTVRADSPVSISFIGYDAGRLSLSSNGNVSLLGSLYNQSGSTSLSVNGSLTQANDGVVIAGRDVTLAASGSLGDAAQALRVQVGNTLSASSSQGSIFLQAINGGVNLARLEAVNGNVQLAAQGNISAGGNVTLRGRSIDLRSTHGSIGSAGQWLNLDTGSHSLDSPALLRAEAVGDIYVEEVSGDLWVDRIAAGGNVGVKVGNGDLLDGNSQLSYDERSLAQLRDLWADMGLTGSQAQDALDQQREVLVEAGNYDYARYWRLRNLAAVEGGGWTADAFDTRQALLNTAQIAQLTELGWSAEQIAEEQSTRVADYQRLHQRFGGVAYDEHYQYQLSAEDQAQLGQTAAWSEDQLRFSIAASLLNRGSGSTAVDEAMNIEGRDVTLIAKRIGRLLADDVVIDLSQGAASLTQAQRAALAGAEQDDIYFDEHNPLVIRIAQRDDVNVKAGGMLTLTAEGDVFLGGEQDFNLYDVRGDSIRIKTDGNIESANGNNLVIRGHDVVLEAANGSIGGQGAVNLSVSGSLTARGNSLNLIHHGDLSIQRLTGLNGLDLTVLGNLRSASTLGENLLGGDIDLKVSGDIGSRDARVQIGTGSADERINLDVAGDAWIGGLQGVSAQPGVLRFAQASVGGVLDIAQARDLQQDGDWSLRGLVLALSGNWSMAEGVRLSAADGVFARLGGVARLARVEALGAGADLDIEALSLAAVADGDRWLATDTIRLRSTGDVGAAARSVTLGARELQVDSGTGALYLQLLGGVTGGSLRSAGSQHIITQGDVTLADIESRNAGLSIDGQGLLSVEAIKAAGAIDMSRQAALRIGSLEAGGAWTLAGQAVQVDSAQVGGDVDMTLGGRLHLGSLDAGGVWTLQGTEAEIDSAEVAGRVDMTLSGALNLQRLVGQQDWHLVAASADIESAELAGAVSQTLSGSLRQGRLLAGGAWTLDGQAVQIDSAQVGGDVDMTLGGSLQLGSLDADGAWTLQGTEAEIDSAEVAGRVDMTLSGALNLQRLVGQQDWVLSAATADIGNAWLHDAAVLRVADDLQLAQLTTGGDASLYLGSASSLGSLSVGGDLLLSVAGLLNLDRADVAGRALLRHTGGSGDALRYTTLNVGETLDVEGVGDWQGGQANVVGDVRFTVGSADLGVLDSQTGHLSLAAQRAFAADELHSRQQWLALTAGHVALGNASAAGALTVHSGSDLNIASGRSGADLTLTTASGSLGSIRFGLPVDPADPAQLVPAHLKAAGNLLAQADGDIFGGNAEADLELRLIGRNLSLGRAQSLLEDIFLQAGGDADQGHGNITGQVVEARRDVGIVANGDLNMPRVVYGRNYSLKAGRDLTVGIGGNLDISGIAEAGRDLRFDIGGIVDLQGVKAGRHVSIRSGQYINIDESVEAGGNILLEALHGDISVGQGVRSSGLDSYAGDTLAGNVVLKASGAISTPLIAAANGNVEVSGQRLLLGDIESAQRVDLLSRGLIQVRTSTSGGDQHWQADEQIRFDNLLAGGQALLDSLLDIHGGRLQSGSAAILQAGVRDGRIVPASIVLDTAIAPTLSLWAGDLAHVGDLWIGQALDVHAREARLYGRHTGAGQLDLWIEGSRGGDLAERLDMTMAASRILSPRLYVADSTLVTSADFVDIQDAAGVERLWLDTAQAKIRLDNASPAYLREADVQLYEHDKAFRLQQDALITRTDAYVLHRKISHQVLVPNFSENHDGAQGVEYQGISAARYAQQMSSPGYTAARLGEVLLRFGLPRLPALSWTPAWIGQPVDMQINLDFGARDVLKDDAQEVTQWSL